VQGNIVSCTTTTNTGCIFANITTNTDVAGNKIQYGGSAGYGLAFSGATGQILIEGNTFQVLGGTPTGTISLDSGGGIFPSQLVMGNNRGVDEVVSSVTCAGTITLPLTPRVSITGSGCTINTINGGWPGRNVVLVNNTGSGGTVTLGITGNIASTGGTRSIVNNASGMLTLFDAGFGSFWY
jgi:hypothetical protein